MMEDGDTNVGDATSDVFEEAEEFLSLSEEVESVDEEPESFVPSSVNVDWLVELTAVLNEHCEVNCQNSLLLNRELQRRLCEVRNRITETLEMIKRQFAQNVLRLQKRSVETKGIVMKRATFSYNGSTFFRDEMGRSCPNNPDYISRKRRGEKFPMDLQKRSRHIWSIGDKTGIVQGVKEQVVEYLMDRDRDEWSLKGTRREEKRKCLETCRKEKLSNLLSQLDEGFHIDWNQISMHNVSYRHSPKTCKAMWNGYMHPKWRHSKWTEPENKRLLAAVQAHNCQDWESISKAVGKRSDFQCFVQYQTVVFYNQMDRWRRWQPEDDVLLIAEIERHNQHGVIDWASVSAKFPHKSKCSLQSRYAFNLNPRISRAPFTPQEDLVLLAAVEEYGAKFSAIPRILFPNRSTVQLRSRYRNTLEHRHKVMPWSVEEDEKLLAFVNENGSANWKRFAEELGTHNRTSCRTRFLTIQKFLAQYPTATVADLPRRGVVRVDNAITTQNWIEKVHLLRKNIGVNSRPNKGVRIRRPEQNTNTQKCKLPTTVQAAKKSIKRKVATKIALKLIAPLSHAESEDVRTVSKPLPSPRSSYQKELHEYLKFAYDLRLDRNVLRRAPKNDAALSFVASALGFRLTDGREEPTGYKSDKRLPRRVRCFYEPMLRGVANRQEASTCTLLPPSWSTALGYRALLIQSQSAPESLPADNDELTDEMLAQLEECKEVQLFYQRLRSLFTGIALLVQRTPNMVQFVQERLEAVKASHPYKIEEESESDESCELDEDFETSADEIELSETEDSAEENRVQKVVVEDFENSADDIELAETNRANKMKVLQAAVANFEYSGNEMEFTETEKRAEDFENIGKIEIIEYAGDEIELTERDKRAEKRKVRKGSVEMFEYSVDEIEFTKTDQRAEERTMRKGAVEDFESIGSAEMIEYSADDIELTERDKRAEKRKARKGSVEMFEYSVDEIEFTKTDQRAEERMMRKKAVEDFESIGSAEMIEYSADDIELTERDKRAEKRKARKGSAEMFEYSVDEIEFTKIDQRGEERTMRKGAVEDFESIGSAEMIEYSADDIELTERDKRAEKRKARKRSVEMFEYSVDEIEFTKTDQRAEERTMRKGAVEDFENRAFEMIEYAADDIELPERDKRAEKRNVQKGSVQMFEYSVDDFEFTKTDQRAEERTMRKGAVEDFENRAFEIIEYAADEIELPERDKRAEKRNVRKGSVEMFEYSVDDFKFKKTDQRAEERTMRKRAVEDFENIAFETIECAADEIELTETVKRAENTRALKRAVEDFEYLADEIEFTETEEREEQHLNIKCEEGTQPEPESIKPSTSHKRSKSKRKAEAELDHALKTEIKKKRTK